MENLKKLKIIIMVALLILLTICMFDNFQVKAQPATPIAIVDHKQTTAKSVTVST